MDLSDGLANKSGIVKKRERLSATRVRLTVELPEERVSKEQNRTARKFQGSAQVKGFRKGKAPLDIVKKRYEEDIQKETLSQLVHMGLTEALEETKFVPINRPNIQFDKADLSQPKALEFQAEFEVSPEIELRHYKGCIIPPEGEPATDEEVDKAIENIRMSFSTLEPHEAEKPEKGLFGVLKVGLQLVGEQEKADHPKEFTVELGEGKLLPELDKEILEMKVDDRKEIQARFPDDYHDKNFAGKDAKFDCHLLELKKRVLPELNDAFANQVQEGATLLSLKSEIRKDIDLNKKEQALSEQKQKIIEQLVQKNPFEVPNSMIQERAVSIRKWMEEDFKKKGQPFPDLKEDDIKALFQRAEYDVRSALLLGEVAKKESINLDPNKVEAKIEAIAAQMKRSVEETKQFLQAQGILEKIGEEVLTEQVFEFLTQNAEIRKATPEPETK